MSVVGTAASTAAEAELLLACATWERSSARRARVENALAAFRAGSAPDWQRLLDLARAHRLVPHLFRQLAPFETEVPNSARTALAEESRAIALRALLMSGQLAELASAFEADDVPMIAFKGPALSRAAYGEIGVRASTDLDIVVAPPDVDRARAALRRLGYASRPGMSPSQERMLQRSFGHFVYTRDGAPSPVELHWRFSSARYPWTLPPADVAARSRRIPLGEAHLLVPPITDDLFLQAMHGARHQWEQLEWLVAFGERLAGRAGGPEPLDVRALLACADAQRSRRPLLLAVQLADDLLAAPVPDVLRAAARHDQVVTRIAREIAERFRHGTPHYTAAENRAFCLALMERRADRLRFLRDEIFRPTMREWELVQLPEPLLPLYVPIRLVRLAWRAVTGEPSAEPR